MIKLEYPPGEELILLVSTNVKARKNQIAIAQYFFVDEDGKVSYYIDKNNKHLLDKINKKTYNY